MHGSIMKATARSYLWLFWTLAIAGVALDQASKYGIFAWLYSDGTPQSDERVLGTFALTTPPPVFTAGPQDAYSSRELKLVPGTFDIVASYTWTPEPETGVGAALRTVSGERLPYVNRGALFGWGGGSASGDDYNTMFAVVSLLAAAAIIYWSTRPATRGDRMLCAALGLILAGTLGNFYDRIVFSGVRDFLHWYRFYNWPVFNLADSCLVVGAGLLLVHAYFHAEKAEDEQHAAAEAPATVEAMAAQPTSSANG
jgi:signal peptidase II